ncbi:YciI family protein [Thiolapillus sp.]
MLYCIIGTDKEDSLKERMAARPAHIERLRQLQSEGRLLLAGPNPAVDAEDPGEAGFTGSLIVAEFPSLKDAESWAATDPYVSSGVFRHVSVKPFRKVFPE